MRLPKYYTVCLVIFSMFLAAGCESSSGDYNSFEWDLRGTWESNDPSMYSGRIIINYDTIKIENYDESQTPFLGDPDKLPFKGIPKDRNIKGYSEDGRIFIEGFSPEGIPYELIEIAYREYILRFNFGGRAELLDKIDE